MVKRQWENKTIIPKELFGKEVQIGGFGIYRGVLEKMEGTFVYLVDAYEYVGHIWENKPFEEKKVGNIWIELNTIEYVMILQDNI